MGAMVRSSPRRARSSSTLATSMPAASRQAIPSSWAAWAARPKAGGGRRASRALARFMSSLRYFQRRTSACTCELKREARSAAATFSAVGSAPEGNRPMSRMPVTGAEWACTTPSSRWVAGNMTVIP